MNGETQHAMSTPITRRLIRSATARAWLSVRRRGGSTLTAGQVEYLLKRRKARRD